MFLEQNGYSVLEATGGDQALKLFRKHTIDAVVVDCQMPGINGDVVAAKIKRLRSCVPVMLLSAYGPLPKRKLKSVDIFFSKSQSPDALLSALNRMLDTQSKPFFTRWLEHWTNRNRRSDAAPSS